MPPQQVLDRHRVGLGEQQRHERRERRPGGARAGHVVRGKALADLDEALGQEMACRQDAAVGAVGHHGEEQRVLAGQHREAGRLAGQELERLCEDARAVLDADDVRHFRELEQRVVRKVHRGPVGDVVDQHVAVGRRGDAAEVGDHPVLARPVVVGADRDDAGEGQALEPAQRLLDLVRGIAAHAHQHRHPAGDARHGAFDDLIAFRIVERGRFARRAEREQPVDTQRDVMLDQPLVAVEIDRAILERRYQWQPEAGDFGHALCLSCSSPPRALLRVRLSEPHPEETRSDASKRSGRNNKNECF